jgi:hypothetical protein
METIALVLVLQMARAEKDEDPASKLAVREDYVLLNDTSDQVALWNWIRKDLKAFADLYEIPLPVVREAVRKDSVTLGHATLEHVRQLVHLWREYNLKRIRAASLIQRVFRKSISNPEYALCRKRLQREWRELTH